MSAQAIHIREATASELPLVEAILLDAYGQYEAELPENLWSAYKEDIVRIVYAAGALHKLLAFDGAQPVGSVFIYASALDAYGSPDIAVEDPFIRLLAVRPSARGKGVATALIRESLRLAAARGAAHLYLHTSDLMAEAVRLYEKLGFARVPEQEHYNGRILVKCYRLELPPSESLLRA